LWLLLAVLVLGSLGFLYTSKEVDFTDCFEEEVKPSSATKRRR